MSACSGWNYNFRCINIVFGVFLRESARTAAKTRTNVSTNSGKATKRLDRLAPNLANMCRFIWEWINAKQIAPRNIRGHLGGFRGSQIQNYWEAVKLAPILVHVCGFIWEWTNYKSPLNNPGGMGGGRGHTFKSLGKLQTDGPIGTTFGTRLRIRLGMDIG